MNDIERIYSLLLHNNGLKIRAISQELKLDKYYVAEIMFSPQNISYWYQDDDSMWFAKEGALHIEEKTEDKLTASIVIPKKIKTERFLQGTPSGSLLSHIKQLSYYRTYTESDIKELIQRYRNGDLKAYEMLVKSQQKLVTSIAFLLRKEGSQLEDLIQEGNIGLIIAINRFDYEQYNTFIVYAKAWIMQSITNYLSSTLYHVRLPLNMLSLYKKTQKFIDEFTQKNEYPPSINDIEIDEDVSYEKLSLLFQLPSDLNEMTSFVEDFGNIPDVTNMPDNNLMQESLKYDVLRLVYSLPERERTILINFYGLNGKAPQTLEEIGELYGLTRERARQIKEKAIRKLRYFLFRDKDEEFENKASLKFIQNRWKRQQKNQFDVFLCEHTVGEPLEIGTNPAKCTPKLKEKAYHESKYTDAESLNTYDSPELSYNKEDLIPNKTKAYLLQIMSDAQTPMTLQEIYTEANNKYFDWRLRIESVEYLLTQMREVWCMLDGRFRLIGYVRKRPMANTDNKPIDVLINRPAEVISKPKESRQKTEKYTLSTPLRVLVADKILTRKMLKHCANKGLYTIGDVNAIIQKYHLTPDSTRFTQYTIDMWFKIVGLLNSDIEKKSTEENNVINNRSDQKTFADIFKDYSKKIRNMRQATIKGNVILAKPMLLLSVINGIDEGIIKNNRIFLGDWLVNRYNTLMRTYNNTPSITEISMPFWYLKSDGFWHIQFHDQQREVVYKPSVKFLNDNVEYAYLDNELWILLQTPKWRTKLRDFILEYKLSEEYITAKSPEVTRKKTSVSTRSSSRININQDGLYDSDKDKPWTGNEEKSLTYFFNSGRDIASLAKLFGRSESAVRLHLAKLRLI